MRFQVFALALLMPAFTIPVLADGLSASVQLDIGVFSCSGNKASNNVAGPVETSCSVSGTFDDGIPTDFYRAAGSATGVANFGHLFASAAADFDGGGESSGFEVTSVAQFNDTLTVSLAKGGSGFISYALVS